MNAKQRRFVKRLHNNPRAFAKMYKAHIIQMSRRGCWCNRKIWDKGTFPCFRDIGCPCKPGYYRSLAEMELEKSKAFARDKLMEIYEKDLLSG